MIILFGAGVECQVRLHYMVNDIDEAFGSHLSCRIAWAAGVALGAWVAGGISGAHLNPAVTVALAAWRRFPRHKIASYIAAQVLGCTFGAFVVYYLYHDSIALFEDGARHSVLGPRATAGLFFTFPSPLISLATAYLTELIATATLLFLVMAFGDKGNWALSQGSLPIGLFLAVLAIGSALGFNTGYALNPARDLGPRIALTFLGYGSEIWTHDYAYWFFGPGVAPIAGGTLGVFLYDAFLYTGEESLVNARYVTLLTQCGAVHCAAHRRGPGTRPPVGPRLSAHGPPILSRAAALREWNRAGHDCRAKG